MWPNSPTVNARHSLSQLLYSLRAKLPAGILATTEDKILLNNCDADFVEIKRLVFCSQNASAIGLYKGRFLPQEDFLSPNLMEWRDRVEDSILQAVGEALRYEICLCGTHDVPLLIDKARLLLDAHPYSEHAQVALLEGLARRGDFHEVSRTYKHFAQRNGADIKLPGVDSFSNKSVSYVKPPTVRFVGRDEELKLLQSIWSEVEAGIGQVAVILGEPGIGKTRLADQFTRVVALQGGKTLVARCCAATQRLPFGLSDALHNELGCQTKSNNQAPSSNRETPGRAASQSDQATHELTNNLTQAVLNKCGSQPVVVLIDDAQWADDYTALLLSYWSYRLRGERVLLLLTVRTEDAEPLPRWITSDLGSTRDITLGRIGIEAAAAIAREVESIRGKAIPKELREAVIWQSGGRPFLLIEALNSVLSTDDHITETPQAILTQSAESVLRRRFRDLSSASASVMAGLATTGSELAHTTLARVADIEDPAEFAQALDSLCTRGIATWNNGMVSFPHDLMREAAYRFLPPATRALFHRRVAHEFKQSGTPPGIVAQHYEHAGEQVLASVHAELARDEALATHSYESFEFYSRMVLRNGSTAQQTRATELLAAHFVSVGRTGELSPLCKLLQPTRVDHQLLLAIAELEAGLASGDVTASALLERAHSIVILAETQEQPRAVPIYATLIDIALDAGAREFGAKTISRLSKSCGDNKEGEIVLQSILAVWQGVTEGFELALPVAQAALMSSELCGSPTTRALCVSSVGTLLLLAGCVEAAQSHFDRGLKLALDAGDIRRQVCIYNNGGVALMESGSCQAREYFERVVTAPNVHAKIRGFGNLAIYHLEHFELVEAHNAASALLSMNVSYGSKSLDVLAQSLLGLIAYERGDLNTMNQHAMTVLDAANDDNARLGVACYPALLLSRMLSISGDSKSALTILERTILENEGKDTLCVMRLLCEKSRIMASHDSDKAFAIASPLLKKATQNGAALVAGRVHKILETVRFV